MGARTQNNKIADGSNGGKGINIRSTRTVVLVQTVSSSQNVNEK